MAETENDIEFANRVCSLISVDPTAFSPELINSFDFRGTAEMLVRKSVTDYDVILSGDDERKKSFLESCVAVQTAILLIPNARKEQIKIQQTTHAKVEFFENSAFDGLLESLNMRLAALYDEINGAGNVIFPFIDITNPNKRFYGAGFDV